MSARVLRRRPALVVSGDWPVSVHPVLRRILTSRGVKPDGIEQELKSIYTPAALGGVTQAVELLTDAIIANRYILVAGDYDCDGATGTAVGVRGLRLLGATRVGFRVPNRFLHGYGLSKELVESMDPKPDMIITVDSGIASHEGVRYAKSLGIQVIITDHHLPGDLLPDADAIVNPNLAGDPFPSKALAGVGVMFYLLWALKQHLTTIGIIGDRTKADLTTLLDLVALGTVADLVPLDHNNRILVYAGLRRIRMGLCCKGIAALVAISKKDLHSLTTSDIGFSVAPRLNAAGRLENMSLGVETLLTDSAQTAAGYVEQLDTINTERRNKQEQMTLDAESIIAATAESPTVGVVVYDASWHPGIVGLVASKVKENLHRPCFAFAPTGKDTDISGSGRSIEGFHLRDALAEIDVRKPGLIHKFGGHAMAAGLTIRFEDLPMFTTMFDQIATAKLAEEQLQNVLLTDGDLDPEDVNVELALLLRDCCPWGQAFPEPVFDNVFECVSWSILKDKHIKMELKFHNQSQTFSAIWFSADVSHPVPPRVHVAYHLGVNSWRGNDRLQLVIQYLEAA